MTGSSTAGDSTRGLVPLLGEHPGAIEPDKSASSTHFGLCLELRKRVDMDDPAVLSHAWTVRGRM